MKLKQPTKPTLEEVASHFEDWRGHKKNKRGRIPEQLWSEAIGLLGEHRISQVAKNLRLSATDLKKHQAAFLAGAKVSGANRAASFVEVKPAVVGQASSLAVQPVRVELERPDGLRLRIESGTSDDLLRVVERFMENRPCCS